MIFDRRELTQEEEAKVMKYLGFMYSEMLKNIDEFTNMKGEIILTTRSELRDKLAEVI